MLELARAAADRVFDDPDADAGYEPDSRAAAVAAVTRLAERWANAGGTVRQMRENARAGAEVLSDDRLQGLSEIIQNADDADATTVRFRLDGEHLLVSHDGRPVVLKDVHFLASPWLTGKRGLGKKLGRFGIGMSTIHAVADGFELHCGPYHVWLGEPNLGNVDARQFPSGFDNPAATVLVVRLRDGSLSPDDLLAWAATWDDSGLLFCSTVRRVIFSAGHETRTLSLGWDEIGEFETRIGNEPVMACRRTAVAPDGRAWIVTTAEPPSPQGLTRANKKTDPTTPIGVALRRRDPGEPGELFAGLPLVGTWLPMRASAQLDPVTGRRALADRPWNDAVLALVTDLWTDAMLDLFEHDPSSAWQVVPLEDVVHHGGAGPTGRFEDRMLDQARTVLSSRLNFAVGGERLGVDQLATQVPQLEGLLTDSEVAELAGVAAALPLEARDPAGRWRDVLRDWRENGASLPEPVTVSDALALIDEPDRDPYSVIDLAAAAIDADLEDELEDLRCIVTRNDTRLRPPSSLSTQVLITRDGGLAQALRIGMFLHDAHLADNPRAVAVMNWLRGRKATIDGDDDTAVLTRLSVAGLAGRHLPNVLEDQQFRSLRDAFEALTPADWTALGPGVGKAILIDAFEFDSRGRKVAVQSSPSDAYLPKTIDRDPDGFYLAAGTTPDLTWVANRYASVLKSSLGRAGLGAQKFLGILGAAKAPRIIRHRRLEAKYAYERRSGIAAYAYGSPAPRGRMLGDLGADYTLEDLESPDLDAVLLDIAKDRKATSRRQRASAVLATLGRAWPDLADSIEVDAAQGYHAWRHKGTTRSWWLWRAATINWLDNSAARPSAPMELRLRTPGTVAVHGSDDEDYLHRAFEGGRRDVLSALGVAGEPSTADLVRRLVEIRADQEADAEEAASAAVVYQALAQRLGSHARLPGDLPVAELRRSFNQGEGLIRTADGWHPPTRVLRGPPVFGSLRAFVPQIPETDRLWATLHVREPGIADCIDVLVRLGRSATSDVDTQTITLEALRLLANLATAGPVTDAQRRRLSKMPLWTTHGWKTSRPVYAVSDPVLAAGLAEEVPVWLPGGELSQFAALVGLCRLTTVSPVAHATAADSDIDEDASLLLRDAISVLHEDLARNDPETHARLRTTWATLAEFDVRVTDTVRVIAEGLEGGPREVTVAAYADIAARALFVTDPEAVATVDAGGHAIAALFDSDRRRVAHAWLAAVQQARTGRAAMALQLASERAAAEKLATEAELAERVTALQDQTANRRRGTTGTRKRPKPPSGTASSGGVPTDSLGGESSSGSQDPPRNRVLVDPGLLYVVDPDGKIVTPKPGEAKKRRRRRRGDGLPDPKPGGATPQSRTGIRGYSDLDKETLGYELACMVLASDADDMIDLRAQHGVGADAVNKLRQFFELKVYAGAEPDVITLEPSQISRAMSTPDFFLVVVSGVEGGEARPKVRVIVDPIGQLGMVQTSQVRFDGVRNSHSLVFELAPHTQEEPPS